MNIEELQIYFQQKITDIDPSFESSQRPDSFSIVNNFNKALNFYIQEKYLNVKSYEERLIIIDNNLDEIAGLITSGGLLYHNKTKSGYNWDIRGQMYRLPDNCLSPISLTATVTRTEVLPMTDQKQFALFVNRKQAEKLISDTSDKVIHTKPLAFIEDEFYLTLVGDAYVTSISAGELVYLRKPFTLSLEYSELINNGGAINISSITTGTYFRALCDVSYAAVNYIAGSKIQKIAGQNSVTVTAVDNVEMKIGYPYGLTNVPDIADSSHMLLVDLAVKLFMDDAKLKLIQRQTSK